MDYSTIARLIVPELEAPLTQALRLGISARMFNNANLATVNNVALAVTFNSVRYDTGGIAGGTGFTIVEAGTYHFGAGVRFAANAVGERTLLLQINGAALIKITNQQAVIGGGTTDCEIHTDYQMAAGDLVQLLAFQNSGGALNILSVANYSIEFWIHRCA